ncbi:hypothetical protein J4Q44_G00221390 [Coregonus suidteri]|uniref:Uncharacterized protein n=1 Tax=Coregonus suidteri TaxID=861788 RepID=A0AAN8LS56_9TELE
MRCALMTGFTGSNRVRHATFNTVISSPQTVFEGWKCLTALFVAALSYLCYIYWDRIELASQAAWSWVTKYPASWKNSGEKVEQQRSRKRLQSPLLIKVKRLELKVTAMKRTLMKHCSHRTSPSCTSQHCSQHVLQTKGPVHTNSSSDWESAA